MINGGQSFLSGAFILMLSSITVRLIGAFFKIPLTAMLGGEGMGYYMTAYSVLGPAFALSVAGFSISVSRLCSAAAAQGRNGDRKRIFSTALILFSLIGAVLSVIIYIASPLFVKIVHNEASIKAVRAMIPALLCCCISSVFRGYYEGIGNMIPTAVSQVTEAVTKLIFGMLFAWSSINKAVEEFSEYGTVFGQAAADAAEAMALAAPNAAAAAISGVSVSTAVGCLVAVIFYLKNEKSSITSDGKVLTFSAAASALIRTALPVSAAALVINMASIVDILSIMNRINAAAAADWGALCRSRPELLFAEVTSERVANFLYGAYTGLAMTVFNLAPAFTSSIGICALPLISSLYAKGKKSILRMRIESVLKITMAAAFPIGMGMSAMAEPILNILFSTSRYEASVAASALRTLGIASIFVAISGVINSMLQAIGRIYVPLKLLLCGSVIKLTINWILISIPGINIMGAPWGTLCCYLFIMLGGTWALMRSVETDIGLFPMMIKPVVSSMACCFSSRLSMIFMINHISYRLSTVASISIGAVVYITFLVILGGFDAGELELLGNNSKINKLLRFCGLFTCKSQYNAVK